MWKFHILYKKYTLSDNLFSRWGILLQIQFFSGDPHTNAWMKDTLSKWAVDKSAQGVVSLKLTLLKIKSTKSCHLFWYLKHIKLTFCLYQKYPSVHVSSISNFRLKMGCVFFYSPCSNLIQNYEALGNTNYYTCTI